MSYDLFIGDYAYSSWSLRAWLLFDRFGLPVRTEWIRFDTGESVGRQLAGRMAPARTVPALRTPEGAVIGESLAIAEELAQRHPDAGLWPADPRARATARALAAEMHSGFAALRDHCPMNLRRAYAPHPLPEAVLSDLRRLEAIWAHARGISESTTPWLCGPYSVADAFFAPVAARIAGYSLPVDDAAMSYVTAHLSDPSFRRWRASGRVSGSNLAQYARDYTPRDWPGPVPSAAIAVGSGPSVNAACPYSGKPVTDFLEFDGRIWGFCNAFCRDKTVADPDAWPAFTDMAAAA